jgi:hypothetical protein
VHLQHDDMGCFITKSGQPMGSMAAMDTGVICTFLSTGNNKVMHESSTRQNKGPIFIVGSPRSGTSILTWCLGQHANILPQEESNWLGEFAVTVGVQQRVGHNRGERSQLGALGIERSEFFKTFGDAITEMILRHRSQLEQKSRSIAEHDPTQVHPALNISKSNDDPKSRWVDGTPEYSLYICGLKKLFPDAKFVHIARDVQSVVNSILNFKPDGSRLVKTEQEAYEYWIRTVEACMQAELALGQQAMYRLRYDDLIHQPALAMRSVLDFLDEPFMAACTEPLALRINSSNVPVDFRAAQRGTNSDVVKHALQLNQQLQNPFRVRPPSAKTIADFEATFDKQVTATAELATEYGLLDTIVKELFKALNWCGATLAMNTAAAILVNLNLILNKKTFPGRGHLLWLSFAIAGAIIYAITRRKGLHKLLKTIFRKIKLGKLNPHNARDIIAK